MSFCCMSFYRAVFLYLFLYVGHPQIIVCMDLSFCVRITRCIPFIMYRTHGAYMYHQQQVSIHPFVYCIVFWMFLFYSILRVCIVASSPSSPPELDERSTYVLWVSDNQVQNYVCEQHVNKPHIFSLINVQLYAHRYGTIYTHSLGVHIRRHHEINGSYLSVAGGFWSFWRNQRKK